MSLRLNQKFHYKSLERITQPDGVRHYICPDTGKHLPSVTTVIDSTSNKTELLEWRKRVGDREAERIKQEAVGLGSLMHLHLENYVLGQPRPGGNNLVRVLAARMADQIIHNGLSSIDEVWGSEVALWHPGLYAGTTDLCGLWKGQQAVLDFKTARKLRTAKQIEGYFNQLAAYALAHDELYGTAITTGVIFMVDRQENYKEFVITSSEFQHYKMSFIDRLENYISKSQD